MHDETWCITLRVPWNFWQSHWLQTLHFLYLRFHSISTHLVRLGPSVFSTWSQVPTSFCPWISWMILGFHPNFHRPKHNRNLQWNQFFSSSCTWSFICHTINNVPYIMGATEGNRHEWLGLQLYKKTSSSKRFTTIQWFKNNFWANRQQLTVRSSWSLKSTEGTFL